MQKCSLTGHNVIIMKSKNESKGIYKSINKVSGVFHLCTLHSLKGKIRTWPLELAFALNKSMITHYLEFYGMGQVLPIVLLIFTLRADLTGFETSWRLVRGFSLHVISRHRGYVLWTEEESAGSCTEKRTC